MTRAAVARYWVTRVVRALLVGVTGLECIALIFPSGAGFAHAAAGLLLATFIPLAFSRARAMSRALFTLLLIVVSLLAYFDSGFAVLWQALPQAVLFAAFLSVLQFMRFAVGQSGALQEVQRRLGRLPPNQLLSTCTVGAFTLGSFLNVGAHALMASSLPPDTPARERRRAALASLLGVAFATFWSPFFVALAFVTHQMPGVSTWHVMILGLGLGVLGILGTLGLNADLGGIGRILRSLGPFVPGATVAAAVLVIVCWLAGFSALQAIVLCVPVLAFAYFFVQRGGTALATAATGLGKVADASDEILVISGAVVLAACMKSLPVAAAAHWLAALPPVMLLAATIGLMILAGLLGMHPTISTTLLIATLVHLPAGVSPASLASALLVGWGLATMVSPVGLTAMIAGQVYRVPHLRLIFSRNLAYVLIIASVSAILLGCVSHWTGGRF